MKEELRDEELQLEKRAKKMSVVAVAKSKQLDN